MKEQQYSMAGYMREIRMLEHSYVEATETLDSHFLNAMAGVVISSMWVYDLFQFARIEGTEEDPHGWMYEMFQQFHEATHKLGVVHRRILDALEEGQQDRYEHVALDVALLCRWSDFSQTLSQQIYHVFLGRKLFATFNCISPSIRTKVRSLLKTDLRFKELMQALQMSSPLDVSFDLLCFHTVQRLAQYPMQLKQLLDNTPPSHFHYAPLARLASCCAPAHSAAQVHGHDD